MYVEQVLALREVIGNYKRNFQEYNRKLNSEKRNERCWFPQNFPDKTFC